MGKNVIKRVCVFCGSSSGSRHTYEEAAVDLARALNRRGYGLVYGGARVGLMGAVANAVLSGGGEVIGVIPEMLMTKEIGHSSLTQLHIVDSMHQRKALMEELSDAFIALPGGFGTLEEFCEIVTWAQLGLHRKPCGLLNIDSYYDRLLNQFEHCINEGFITNSVGSIALHASTAEELLDCLENYVPQNVTKWIDRSST